MVYRRVICLIISFTGRILPFLANSASAHRHQVKNNIAIAQERAETKWTKVLLKDKSTNVSRDGQWHGTWWSYESSEEKRRTIRILAKTRGTDVFTRYGSY